MKYTFLWLLILTMLFFRAIPYKIKEMFRKKAKVVPRHRHVDNLRRKPFEKPTYFLELVRE